MNVEIDLLDEDEVLSIVDRRLARGLSTQIVTANPEIVLGARNNPTMTETLSQAEIVTADGVGLRLAGKLIHKVKVPKVTGVDLATRIFNESRARGYKIFFLGAKPGIAEMAAARARDQFGAQVAGFHHGYFQDPEPVWKLLAETRPNIVLVGLGSPKQELFIHEARNRTDLAPALYMGVGGAFDVLSGTVKRAPKFFQVIGAEWLFRVASQPSRLKRLRGFPYFMLWVLKESLLVRVGIRKTLE